MRSLWEAPLVGLASERMPSVQGFQDFLTDDEREGWNTGAYHKTLDDRHLLHLCRKCDAPSQPHQSSTLRALQSVSGQLLDTCQLRGPATLPATDVCYYLLAKPGDLCETWIFWDSMDCCHAGAK